MNINNKELELAIELYNKVKPQGKDVFGKKICLSDYDFDESYNTNVINKSTFLNCRFIETPFIGVSSAYTSYKGCTFKDCKTQNTNFTFCDFSLCHIYGTDKLSNWIANDFSYSMFSGSKLKKIFFEGTPFYQAIFDNATLEEVSFKHCCFDSVIFNNASIQNIDFSNIELLLCNFENANIINSKFTIIMLLNNFGLLPIYLNSNEIKIVSGEDKIMTKEEVLYTIKNLIPLFWANHDFFPLCNIYLYLYEFDIAYKTLLECLEISIKEFDFMQINQLCKLAVYSYKFPTKHLNDVYKFIDNKIDTRVLSYSDARKYLRCNDEIKYLLQINPQQQPILYLSLKTDANNTDELGKLLKSIEKAIREIDEEINPIYNIQHHSPYEIILTICATVSTLLPIAQFFYYINGGLKSGHDLLAGRKKRDNNDEVVTKDNNDTSHLKREVHTQKKTISIGNFNISFTSEDIKTFQLINDVTYVIDEKTLDTKNSSTQAKSNS